MTRRDALSPAPAATKQVHVRERDRGETTRSLRASAVTKCIVLKSKCTLFYFDTHTSDLLMLVHALEPQPRGLGVGVAANLGGFARGRGSVDRGEHRLLLVVVVVVIEAAAAAAAERAARRRAPRARCRRERVGLTVVGAKTVQIGGRRFETARES